MLFAVIAPGDIFAQDVVNSKYFNVVVHPGVEKRALLKELRADYFLQMNVAFPDDSSKDPDIDSSLTRTLDAIYLNVSDALDIHMYSFSIGLEIFSDRTALADELQQYFNKRIDTPSFYSYEKNKIFISAKDITLGMLSHEITHAIVSHYFIVPPSTKVQEVLAGYAEYSMRKIAK